VLIVFAVLIWGLVEIVWRSLRWLWRRVAARFWPKPVMA
jgi:hypothetical protein